jgi:hypothetical protein
MKKLLALLTVLGLLGFGPACQPAENGDTGEGETGTEAQDDMQKDGTEMQNGETDTPPMSPDDMDNDGDEAGAGTGDPMEEPDMPDIGGPDIESPIGGGGDIEGLE